MSPYDILNLLGVFLIFLALIEFSCVLGGFFCNLLYNIIAFSLHDVANDNKERNEGRALILYLNVKK